MSAVANNNQQNAAAAPQGGGMMNALLRGIMMYMFLNVMKSRSSNNNNNTHNPTSTMVHNHQKDNISNRMSKEQYQGMKPRGATTNTNTNTLDLNTKKNYNQKMIMMMKRPTCLWEYNGNTMMDLHLYITDSEEYSVQDCYDNHYYNQNMNNENENYNKKDENGDNDTHHHGEVLAEWHELDLQLGSSPSSSINSNQELENIKTNMRSTNVTIPFSHKVQFNQTHVYAHICMIRKSFTSSSQDDIDHNNNNHNVYVKTVQMTKYKKRKRIRDEKNLLSSSTTEGIIGSNNDLDLAATDDNNKTNNNSDSSKIISPLTIASANKTQECTLLYIKPSLSLQLVNMNGLPSFPERRAIPEPISKHISWYNDTYFYPILYSNEFWILKSSLIEVNDTISSTNIEITIDDVSFWKWQLMSQMEESFHKQSEINGDDDSGNDMFRTMLLETNPILLAITAIVSVLHTIFDVLAFKNDINFFKGKKSMEGLSLRSMVVNTAFQVVILLYLLDNDTSFMILVSNGVGVAIEIWKISKAVKLSIFDENGNWNFEWKESDTYSKSTTKEYDEIATDHLMFVTMPLVCGYGLYSLFHQKHKGWYSWILNTLVGFIYMFGFVMMTPQVCT